MINEKNREYKVKTSNNREKKHIPLKEDTYVDQAEQVISQLKREPEKNIVSTSKIRNLLAMTADIYNDVVSNERDEELSLDVKRRINYLKIRFAYEAGRDLSVRNFVEKADILEHLNDIYGKREKYLLFNRYMEALVAFRKYYIKKDE